MFDVEKITKIDHVSVFKTDGDKRSLAIFCRAGDKPLLLMAKEVDLSFEVEVNSQDIVFGREKFSLSKNAVIEIAASCFPDANNLLFQIFDLNPQPKQVKKSDIEKLFGCDIVNG